MRPWVGGGGFCLVILVVFCFFIDQVCMSGLPRLVNLVKQNTPESAACCCLDIDDNFIAEGEGVITMVITHSARLNWRHVE